MFTATAFNCPFCNAYAEQRWSLARPEWGSGSDYRISRCTHCGDEAMWKAERMIYPDSSPAPTPNPDLPEDIKTDYEEARTIISRSPRGACVLLRLCVQKLCGFLGESGKDINADIAALVKKGLNPKIQKSLDIVRVIGNEAVHPGQIDLKDDHATAIQLFQLVNVIVDAMIGQPKRIDAVYERIPPTQLKQIEERDNKSKKP